MLFSAHYNVVSLSFVDYSASYNYIVLLLCSIGVSSVLMKLYISSPFLIPFTIIEIYVSFSKEKKKKWNPKSHQGPKLARVLVQSPKHPIVSLPKLLKHIPHPSKPNKWPLSKRRMKEEFLPSLHEYPFGQQSESQTFIWSNSTWTSEIGNPKECDPGFPRPSSREYNKDLLTGPSFLQVYSKCSHGQEKPIW